MEEIHETSRRNVLLIFCAWRNLILRGETRISYLIEECLEGFPSETGKLRAYVMWFSPVLSSSFRLNEFLPLGTDENFMKAWAEKAGHQGGIPHSADPSFRYHVQQNRLTWSKALANMIFDDDWGKHPNNTINFRWDDIDPESLVRPKVRQSLPYHQTLYQVLVSIYLTIETGIWDWELFMESMDESADLNNCEEALDLFEQETSRLRKSTLAVIPLAKDNLVETDEVVKSPFWCKVVEIDMTRVAYLVLELGLGCDHIEALLRVDALSVR